MRLVEKGERAKAPFRIFELYYLTCEYVYSSAATTIVWMAEHASKSTKKQTMMTTQHRKMCMCAGGGGGMGNRNGNSCCFIIICFIAYALHTTQLVVLGWLRIRQNKHTCSWIIFNCLFSFYTMCTLAPYHFQWSDLEHVAQLCASNVCSLLAELCKASFCLWIFSQPNTELNKHFLARARCFSHKKNTFSKPWIQLLTDQRLIIITIYEKR